MRVRGVLAAVVVAVAGFALVPASAATGTSVSTGIARGGGLGFDTCVAPSTAVLRAWIASPYRSVNIYFGGSQRGCPNQPQLSADWVTTVLANGWSLIPTYVDLQAPAACYGGSAKASMSADPAVAATQGTSAGQDAATQLQSLGLAGTVAYLDLEPFDSSKDATCAPAVQAFVDAWTVALHGHGDASGVYVNANHGAQMFVAGYASDADRVDDIWVAEWNAAATADDAVLAGTWPHHRIHQYFSDASNGTGSEVFGNETLGIDRDAIDGDVAAATGVTWPAGPPYGYAVSGTPSNNLNERPQANSSQQPVGMAKNGDPLSIACQALGETVDGDSVWDRLTGNGSYVSDIYTTTTGGNGLSPHIARCDKTAPKASLGSLPAATVGAAVTVSWSATDAANPNGERSGISSSTVRYRRAPWNGGFGAWHTVGTTTGRSMRLPVSAGYDYCVAVMSRDLSGNASAWSAQKCVVRALDDRSLAVGTGWTSARNTRFYEGTYTQATRSGRVLSRTHATATRLAIVATTCSRCGAVRVSIAGHYVGTVNLYSSSTHWQRVLVLPSFVARTGTVVLTTTSAKLVQIDGLAIARA